MVDDFEIDVLGFSLLDLREHGGVLITEVLANVIDGGGSEPVVLLGDGGTGGLGEIPTGIS